MEKNFTLQNKIIWRGEIAKDTAVAFYPSFYKNIIKKEKIFLENFKAVFEDVNMENLNDKFIPLYRAEIMSRKKFTLDRDSIIDSITQKIKNNSSRYKFLFIYDNERNLFGATLIAIDGDKLQIAYRAYKRDVKINALKHKVSLDYWGEKLIREYGCKLNLKIFSQGRDTNPYIGKTRIGLALYKLKTGTKPKLPELNNPEKPIETKKINESFFLSQEDPVVFFNNPDRGGFYQNCFLYYPQDSIHESLVNEFKVVSEWAGIVFESVVY